jgi:hypothetical protein
MPKLRGQLRPLRKGDRPIGPERAPTRPSVEFPHDASDHISWQDDLGQIVRTCVCVCSDCWPEDGSPCAYSTVPC